MFEGHEEANGAEQEGHAEESGDDRMQRPEAGHPMAGEDVGAPGEGSPGSAAAEVTPEISDQGQA